MKDLNDDLNDYGILRTYKPEDFIVIFNAEHINQLRKADVPQVYHIDTLLKGFTEYELPARYFGTKISETADTVTITDDGNTYRTLIEGDFGGKHLYPGMKLPVGATVKGNEAYKEDKSIVFKIVAKKGVPTMSSFVRSSAFFNAHTLKTNNYLTFGTNSLEYLKEFPFITAYFVEPDEVIDYDNE
jgi:hypothetical protein